MEIITLNSENLSHISEGVSKPQYDRAKVIEGIVHVGVGGFHRAHQAVYTDQLLHDESMLNWGICGIGLLEADLNIYKALTKQEGLYTLIVKEIDGSLTKKIVGSIVNYLFAPEDPLQVIEKMAHPDVKIITLTITEGGYNYSKATDSFDHKHPLIEHDLRHPKSPKTIFGYLTQALKLRRDNKLACTIQSCDNIQGNGHLTKRMLLSYVELAEPELMPWIESHVSFPNSMVDRITPVTTRQDVLELRESVGIEDMWPVVCEPFRQWIIEDDFIAGRPPWEQVGAQFVEDVEPYEKMKLALLNAGHSVLGILGSLIGLTTIDEAVNHPAFRLFLRHYMDKEVSPTLDRTEGIDVDKYKDSLFERFGNTYIKDQVDRICSESSAKIPIFILPTVIKQIQLNGSIEHAAFVIAAWAIYCLGLDEGGQQLNIQDEMKDILQEQAKLAASDPRLFLDLKVIFGDLNKSSHFVNFFTDAYRNIVVHGVEKAVEDINHQF